jgi:hypothetical protein
MDKAKTRQPISGYVEKHHIIPHSMGGKKQKNNLVVLTAREHFVAHCLLARCVGENYKEKMWIAVWMMQVNPSTKERYKNSRLIAIAKEKMAKATQTRMLGRKWGPMSEETKNKLRKARSKQVITKEAYEKQAKVISSLVWLNNGQRSYRVRPELVKQKLNEGLKEGRLMSFINENYKEKHRQKALKYWQSKSVEGAQL